MALQGGSFFCNVTLRDEGGNVATLRYSLVAADIDEAGTVADTMVTALAPLTSALISGYTVGEQYSEDTEVWGAEGSEIENLAGVVCRLVGVPAKYHTLTIPSPVIGLFAETEGPGKNIVDVSNADLQAYVLNYVDETGFIGAGPDAIALVSDGEKILGDDPNAVIVSGRRRHRKSNRG